MSLTLANFVFQFLITRANMLAQKILDQITTNSFYFNKKICNQYEEILNKINSITHDTDELVELSNYIDNLRFGPLLSLKVSYLCNFSPPLAIKKT